MKILKILLIVFLPVLADAQWQPDFRLTNNPARSYTSYNNARCIVSNENVVHVVWWDKRDENYEIYYKSSTDRGINWGEDIRLTNAPSDSYNPSIAVSNSIVHVTWIDCRDGNGEIYYKRSTDGGVNWGQDIRLTNNTPFSLFPSIAADSFIVHIVWLDYYDDPNGEIYYKKSTDGGLSWGQNIRLTDDTLYSNSPSIAALDSFVHLVCIEGRKVYYKCSSNSGLNWKQDTILINNTSFQLYPSISISGPNIHVVWHEDKGGLNTEIYYIHSTNNGLNWLGYTRLTNDTSYSEYPSVASSGLGVHVVWQDFRYADWRVFYKRTTNNGISWSVDTCLSEYAIRVEFPSISVSGTTVHVIWEDFRDHNYEIYYKRNPTGNTIGISKIGSEFPTSYFLYQNYPNPFNPKTKIKFEIPPLNLPLAGGDKEGVYIKLIIYNILGQEIATLVNEPLKPGTYEVEWNGTDYPSGVYYYQLMALAIPYGTTVNYTETKKFILIK